MLQLQYIFAIYFEFNGILLSIVCSIFNSFVTGNTLLCDWRLEHAHISQRNVPKLLDLEQMTVVLEYIFFFSRLQKVKNYSKMNFYNNHSYEPNDNVHPSICSWQIVNYHYKAWDWCSTKKPEDYFHVKHAKITWIGKVRIPCIRNCIYNSNDSI